MLELAGRVKLLAQFARLLVYGRESIRIQINAITGHQSILLGRGFLSVTVSTNR